MRNDALAIEVFLFLCLFVFVIINNLFQLKFYNIIQNFISSVKHFFFFMVVVLDVFKNPGIHVSMHCRSGESHWSSLS